MKSTAYDKIISNKRLKIIKDHYNKKVTLTTSGNVLLSYNNLEYFNFNFDLSLSIHIIHDIYILKQKKTIYIWYLKVNIYKG